VIPFQFFLCYKMNGCIIICKIIWHIFDFFFDFLKVCAFLRHNEALSCVLLSCSKLRILSVSHGFKSRFYRNSVLLAVLYAFHAADCIGMSLAYAFSPKCVIFSICKDCVCIHTVQGKHSRIPAYGNNSNVTALLCFFIYICKMLRDSGMCVKTVHHIKPFCKLRRLFRKVCRTSSAEDHYIYLIFHGSRLVCRINFSAFCKDFYSSRIATCKYACKLHIRVMFDGALYAPSQISISKNSNTNAHT